MQKKLPLLVVLLTLATLPTFAQKWGYATLIAKSNANSVQLFDTNSVVVKQWTNLSGNTGYSSYLTEGGTLWRTVRGTNIQMNGGGVHGRIQKVAWDGTLLFDYNINDANQVAHHDICPMPNGNVMVIVYVRKTAAEVQAAGATINAVRWSEKVVELKPTGLNTADVVWEWHLWDHLVQNLYPAKANYQTSVLNHPELLDVNYKNSGNMPDWVHMNGIDYNAKLDQIVVSSHNINEMWVIDHSTTTAQAASHSGGKSGKGGDFLYRWGNPAAYQASGTAVFKVMHDAHWVPDDCPRAGWLGGFNNQGVSNSQSAFDLFETTWNGTEYTLTPGQAYLPTTYGYRHQASGYTSNMGSSQQLPNGNHLVCLATAGRVYEIDPDGKQLWNYQTTGAIPQAKRYSKCFIENPKIAVVSTNPSLCAGGSVQLDVTPSATDVNSFTYNWLPSGGNVQDPTVSGLSASTIFTVTVSTPAGCTATASVPVTVLPAPTANAGPDQNIVAGQTANLTATGGTSYLWSTGATTANIAVNPTSTTTYSVTVTGANGCSATDAVTVHVTVPISVSVSASNPAFCPGGSTELLANASGGSGAFAYSWSSTPAGFISNLKNSTVTPTVSTTYVVSVSDGTSTATASVTVTVHPLPLADAGADVAIISGQTTTLTATGGASYHWSTGETTASIAVAPTANTAYSVTVASAEGCTATDAVSVSVKPAVSVAASAEKTAFCLGGSTQLFASAADGTGSFAFVWSSVPAGFSSNAASPVVSPAENTRYIVVVSDGVGSATASVDVVVHPLPQADAGPDQSLPIGNSTTLTATGGADYQWNTNETTASISVAPVLTTTYTVTVTSSEGCTATDAVTVVVTGTPLSAVVSAAENSICLGENTQLSAVASGGTGSYIFDWSSNGVSFSNLQNPSVAPTESGTFTVVVSDGTSSTSESVFVEIKPLPAADAGPDASILIGTSTTLTATGGVDFQWNTNETTASISVKPLATTTYTVTVTGANGCTATDAATVEVTGTFLSGAASASASEICLGENAQLFASASGGSGNYTFVWTANGSVFSNEQNPTVSPTASTTYEVKIEDGISTVNGSIFLKINPLPTAQAGPDATILTGTSTTLTASGGATYVWSTGETSASISVAPAETTVFTVTVTDAKGCSATASATVTVVDMLPLSGNVAATDSVICFGEALQLLASGLGGTGSYAFSWTSDPAGFVSSLPDPFVNPEVTTTYFVEISDGQSTLKLSLTVVVNPLAAQPEITVSGDSLISSSPSNNQWFYYGNPIPDATGQVFVPTQTGSYQVQIVDVNGCFSPLSEPHEFIVGPPLDATLTATHPAICFGEVAQLLASPTGGTGSYAFSWTSDPAGFASSLADPFVNPEQTTTYFVEIFDGTTTLTRSIVITVFPLAPQPEITVSGDSMISSSASNNQWFYYGNPIPGATGQVFVPTLPGSYQVQILDANGCFSPLSEPVEVLTIGTEQVFSNEKWSLAPNPTSDLLRVSGDFGGRSFAVTMFNAAGQQVLRQLDARTISVAGLPSGVYWLRLETAAGSGVRKVVVD